MNGRLNQGVTIGIRQLEVQGLAPIMPEYSGLVWVWGSKFNLTTTLSFSFHQSPSIHTPPLSVSGIERGIEESIARDRVSNEVHDFR